MRGQILDFIELDDSPSSSSDLNPLDYKLGSVLEECACAEEVPKSRFTESCDCEGGERHRDIPLAMNRESIDDWPKRLWCCVQAKGGHQFEY